MIFCTTHTLLQQLPRCRSLCWPVLLLSLLTACAHRVPQTIDDWSQHQTQVQKISHWSLIGKLGVRVPGDNGSATLRWHNLAKNYTLDLSGPFGQGRILISGKPGRVKLEQPGEAPLMADSAEALIYETTGWTLPVAQLSYWVRGIPAPQQSIAWLEKTPEGLLNTLEQAGWRIHYSNYSNVSVTQNNSVQLPGRVVAEYGDIRLTLIIRQWQLDNR